MGPGGGEVPPGTFFLGEPFFFRNVARRRRVKKFGDFGGHFGRFSDFSSRTDGGWGGPPWDNFFWLKKREIFFSTPLWDFHGFLIILHTVVPNGGRAGVSDGY